MVNTISTPLEIEMLACPVCARDDPSPFCTFCGGTGEVLKYDECPRCAGLPGWRDDDGEVCPLCHCVGFVHDSLFDDADDYEFPLTEEDEQDA